MPETYDDDRRGLMRVHIAQRRGDLACERHTRNGLRSFAKGRGLTLSSLHKRDLATRLAYEGFIDADGYLRDGFPPAVTPSPAPNPAETGDPR
jgi:hypothetical protein